MEQSLLETCIKPVKVMVSLLAFMAAAPIQSARAQLSFTCTQNMYMGAVIVPGGNGNVKVTPASAFTATGSATLVADPRPGKCFGKTLASTPAASAAISISAKRTTISNATGSKIRITDFNLKTPSGGRKTTFSSMALANGFTFGIGATAQHRKNESIGAYTGTLTVTITTP